MDDIAFAAKVIEQAKRGVPIAVFMIAGEAKQISTDTDRFLRMVRDFPRRFVGVYNDRAMPIWIADDLSAM